MAKRLTIMLIGILVIIGFLVFGVSWHLSSLVLFPKSNCQTEHYVFCNDPSEIPLKFETVSFVTADGIKLQGWYIPAPESKKTVVMVHGHGGSKNEGLRFAKPLHDAGFNLLLYNSRVFATGDKAYASMGYFEQYDVKAAVDFVLKKKNANSIGLFGFSMGAATSILAMEKDNRIRAGVFSSAYANIIDQLLEVGKRDFGIPEFPIFSIAVALTNLRGKFDLDQIIPEESIRHISPRPVLIMHCDKDHYVDFSHAKRLYAAAKQPKYFWAAPCDKHEFLWNADPRKAETLTTSFFKSHL